MFGGITLIQVPHTHGDDVDPNSYLGFGDEVLGQLDDGEVAAADGAADLVEPHAEDLRLLRRRRLR